jgi:serine/threonine-protein kinase
VQSVLGSGGTAVVFGCWDTLLEVEVALKLFVKNLDVTAQERVRRELVLTRQLSHHNILRCYDIGTHAGSPFITMEVLRGGSLRDKIGKPELTTRLALHCLLQACAGLGHAHEMGVTHRDVKPDNLLLCDDGVLHVMDFGLAKQDTGSHLTQPSMVGGTLQYIAPEQIRDLGSANHLADIYALGAVAYELLTGRAPFDFDDPKIVVASHLMIDPPPPSARNPALSSELDAIVLTAMAKEPAHRYQTCAQLSRALERELAKL